MSNNYKHKKLLKLGRAGFMDRILVNKLGICVFKVERTHHILFYNHFTFKPAQTR